MPSIGNTPPQNGSKDFGDELDVFVRYTIGPRSSVWFGWSRFWRGTTIIGDRDADFIDSYWETDF